MQPETLKEMFTISVTVEKPILVGQDSINGRRQLIPIIQGQLKGIDTENKPLEGVVLPGGVDSQVIRPNGRCELSARYGVQLDDGRSFYIENNGIRTVPDAYVDTVIKGGFIDPSLYYFCTKPEFEVFDPSLNWLNNFIFICKAKRYPDRVDLIFYQVL